MSTHTMEEIKRKLEFDSRQLHCKTIKALCQEITKKKHELVGKEGAITGSTTKISELELLWEKCQDGQPRLGSLCAHAIIDLWENGELDTQYVLGRFINLLPMSSSVHVCVEAVGKVLLLLVIKALNGVMGCGDEDVSGSRSMFLMSVSPHPFISMYKSRQDCWPSLLQETSSLLAQEDDGLKIKVLHMLKPFLKYVLLEPCMEPKQGSMRTLLSTSLARACQPDSSSSFVDPSSNLIDSTSSRIDSSTCPMNEGKGESLLCFADEVTQFLLECLSVIQIHTTAAATEAVHIVTIVMEIISSHAQTIKPRLIHLAVHHCLSLAQQQRALGMDMNPVLLPLAKMRLSGSEVTDDAMVFMLGSLLRESSVSEKHAILRIAQHMHSKRSNGVRETWKALIWPLIQVISTLYGHSYIELKSLEVSQRKNCYQMATEILRVIVDERVIEEGLTTPIETEFGVPSINAWHSRMRLASTVACRILSDVDTARNWLHSLPAKVRARHDERLSEGTIELVVALLMSFGFQLAGLATESLVEIGNIYHSAAYSMTPLFLYLMKRERNRPNELTKHIVHALPRLASHRYLIPDYLKLSRNPGLGPVSLALVTNLWKNQDRVFPYIQDFVSELMKTPGNKNAVTGIDETLLAVSRCIYEVCSLRPEQHGGDMMPALSAVLKRAKRPPDGPATLLALDALIAVIKAEVVDLQSANKVLGAHLKDETRAMVIAKHCEIYALVPECYIDSKEYEVFSESVVRHLWHFEAHCDHRIISSKLTALAEFKITDFDINFLPKDATREVKAKRDQERKKVLEGRLARGEEVDEDEEMEEDLSVPGSCFINLLRCIPDDALHGAQELLHSFMCDELTDLPRRVYTQSTQQQGAPTGQGEDRVIAGIPAAIAHKSDNNKQPGLRPSFAAGRLFCFEPGSDRSRDARAVRRNRVEKGKVWLETLSNLLAQVPVLSSDWLYITQLPQAWLCFLSRAFQAIVEGRRADIERQASRSGNDEGKEGQEVAKDAAWLWARDQIVEQFRVAIANNPGARGNGILALSALSSVVSSHVMQLGDKATATQKSETQFQGHRAWITRVTTSLLAVIEPTFPAESIFQWCLQSRDGDHTNAIAQACASLGIHFLVPHLLTMDTTFLEAAINGLIPSTTSSPLPSSSGSPSLHHGIGAGMLLAGLCQEHYTDMMGSEGETLLLRAFSRLETAALQNNNCDDNVIGCTLGLGIALSGLAHEGATHSDVHLGKVKDEILSKISNAGESADELVQAQAFSAALVTAACYQVNKINPHEALMTAIELQTLADRNIKCGPLAVSVCLLIHCLSKLGHSEVVALFHNQHARLKRQIEDKDSSSEDIRSGVAGLVSLLVGPGHLLWTEHKLDTNHQRGKLAGVVKSLSQLLSDSSDQRLQHSLPWLLGYLHMGSSFVSETQASVPSNYSYLPEVSLLRAAVDFLLRAGRSGSEFILSGHVLTVLEALHQCSRSCERPLPPLNWAVVVNPLMRNASYDDGSLYQGCMQLAIGQCGVAQNPATQSTANFIMSWMTPPLYHTIQESCSLLLFRALPKLVTSVPLKCLESFIMGQMVTLFQPGNFERGHRVPALCGLKLALQVRDPPQGVVNLLKEAVKKIFECLPLVTEYDCFLFAHLSDCILLLEWDDVDSITAPSGKGNLLKGTFTRAYLVRQSLAPPAWLMSCIDESMTTGTEADREMVLWFLLVSFSQASASIPADERVTWLQNLMNFIKTVAFGREKTDSSQSHEKMRMLLDVFSVSIVAWSPSHFSHLCGPHPMHYSIASASRESSQSAACLDDSDTSETSFTSLCEEDPDWLKQVNENSPLGCGETGRRIVRDVKVYLPDALCQLVRCAPWDNIRCKIIDWLINISIDSKDEVVSPEMRKELRGCLLALRHCPEFARDSRWMKVFDQAWPELTSHDLS